MSEEHEGVFAAHLTTTHQASFVQNKLFSTAFVT